MYGYVPCCEGYGFHAAYSGAGSRNQFWSRIGCMYNLLMNWPVYFKSRI